MTEDERAFVKSMVLERDLQNLQLIDFLLSVAGRCTLQASCLDSEARPDLHEIDNAIELLEGKVTNMRKRKYDELKNLCDE